MRAEDRCKYTLGDGSCNCPPNTCGFLATKGIKASSLHTLDKPIDKPITNPVPSVSLANAKQIAGDHYKKYGDLQPWDIVIAWNMGYLDGTALKYIARWKDKGGINDLKKAIHFLEKLIEVTEQAQSPTNSITRPTN